MAKKKKNNCHHAYVVVAIYDSPGQGILMEKTRINNKKFKLQLPGGIAFKIHDSRLGQKQVVNEVTTLNHHLLEIIGYYFYVYGVIKKIFHFVQKGREVKTYLVRLSDEYQDEDDDCKISIPPNMIFVTADPVEITDDPRILSDDKKILLHYLANRKKYQEPNSLYHAGVETVA